MTNLTNVSKFENKLRRIIQLNEKGAVVYTNKTSETLEFCLTKSELIEAFKVDIDETAKDLINALPIINSIKNGMVHELKTFNKSVQFFWKTYYKDLNSIILSGINTDGIEDCYMQLLQLLFVLLLKYSFLQPLFFLFIFL